MWIAFVALTPDSVNMQKEFWNVLTENWSSQGGPVQDIKIQPPTRIMAGGFVVVFEGGDGGDFLFFLFFTIFHFWFRC